MKMKKSTQVAVGGLASALCLVLMFMTGLIPFSTYALPATAGIVLIAVLEENGPQTALLVYGAVSILSMFIVPDREAALTFVVFFGYYPIIKPWFDRIRSKVLRAGSKLLLYNLVIFLLYSVVIRLFGLGEVLNEMQQMGQTGLIVLAVLANIMLILYDRALTALYIAYVRVFRVRILKHLGRG